MKQNPFLSPTGNIDLMTFSGSTFTFNVTGTYRVTLNIEWAVHVTGGREHRLSWSGGNLVLGNHQASNSLTASRYTDSLVKDFAAGDTTGLQVYQNSGGALNVVSAQLLFELVSV